VSVSSGRRCRLVSDICRRHRPQHKAEDLMD